MVLVASRDILGSPKDVLLVLFSRQVRMDDAMAVTYEGLQHVHSRDRD